jgi:hypothetical protein
MDNLPGWRNGRRRGLNSLSTSEGNAGVNGVKVGEFLTGKADDNAELRLAFV